MAYKNFTVETDADGIALVTWDMPGKSMNVFTMEVMDEIDAIVDQIVADSAVKGVVFASGKPQFSGGADITMLNAMSKTMEDARATDPAGATKKLFDAAGRMSWLWRKIETCGKPWVAAINGVCMGGATELAMSCHARIASNAKSVKIALPEVKIGIFPGAGGTQRLPRLISTQDALQIMTTGQELSPSRAKALGLLTDVVEPENLIAAARELLKKGVDPVQPWDKKGFKAPGGAIWSPQGVQLFSAANAILRRETNMNYPGAHAILKCVYEGLQVPFDTALRIEQRYFTHILQTTEAQMMMRSLFVSMQELGKGARRPSNIEPTKFSKVGVIGAGFMGASIAYVTARAGIPVVLIDRDQAAADKGKAHSEELIKGAIAKGKSTREEGEKLLALITATPDYNALADADLVIEAVFEDRNVKKAVIEQIEAVLPATSILASNTSTLPISGLAGYSRRPDQFVGVHFFSPVEKMMLVEVILGQKTEDKALAVALDFAAAIRKTPIVVNDTRGFYVNRCVFRYINEAYDMLAEGVPAVMIENAAKFAGMPVGPMSLNDEVAVDLSYKIMKSSIADLGEASVKAGHMALVDKMVNALGRLGRKAGKGFYDYPPKPAKKSLWPGLKDLYPQKTAEEVDFEELKQRLLGTIALEAARTVEEGIVTDPREADVGSILGFGFAPYTGGTLSYIDGMGVKTFVAMLEKLAAKYGDHFKPTPLLLDMAAKGESFYSRFDPYRRKAAA